MSKSSTPDKPSVPAEAYTKEYYESCCQGYAEFESSKGELLPLRLSFPLKLANIKAGMKVIDIGCGRGEIVIHCARLGAKTWGMDYASEALNLAREIMNNENNLRYKKIMAIQKSKSTHLPFTNESVDLVFMLDVVEHLNPDELKTTLDEVWRILRPKGRLVIHTMPNLDYYRFGYPMYRFIQRFRHDRLPEDPRIRWDYSHVHVNEQTPRKLNLELKRSKFHAKVWLYPIQSYQYEPNRIVRIGMYFLAHLYPFRWIFCNDIFAIGTKRCA